MPRRGGAGRAGSGAPFDVVVTQDDLRDLTRAINAHGDRKAIRRELSQGLRSAVKPLVPAIRRAILSTPGGARSTGLRRDVARSVEMKVDLGVRSSRIGVRVRLNPNRQGSHAGLGEKLEGVTPWRHPVFGHDVWVTQTSHPFFLETIRPRRAAVLRDIERAMDGVSRKLKG
jgi:hypothetical protein